MENEMTDCECGAHPMQSCDWWCGHNLTGEEIWERENPQLAETRKLREEIHDLKELIKTM